MDIPPVNTLIYDRHMSEYSYMGSYTNTRIIYVQVIYVHIWSYVCRHMIIKLNHICSSYTKKRHTHIWVSNGTHICVWKYPYMTIIYEHECSYMTVIYEYIHTHIWVPLLDSYMCMSLFVYDCHICVFLYAYMSTVIDSYMCMSLFVYD